MKKLLGFFIIKKLNLSIFLWLLVFGALFPTKVSAGVIVQQTSAYDNTLNAWTASQDLGTGLSGTLKSATFRFATGSSFDFTANNTRIYDKSDGYSAIRGCVTNFTDQLNGLTFSTTGVPTGYMDVTIDFSCRNFTFNPTHNYMIRVSNANNCTGCLKFAGHTFSDGNDYYPNGGALYSKDNQFCYVPITSYATACTKWFNTKDDLYFVIKNTTPDFDPYPVIFIPGIGGSELKANQDIVWSQDNGHGGIYSHGYNSGEKIWVNESEAASFGDDDYFDVLKLKSDGITSEADVVTNGNLTSFGYGEIDTFFTSMGYTKGTNYFVFNYDWRKDVSSTKDGLDTLIETAKTASGKSKVNIVAHSMGGLVARYYIIDSGKAGKVNKLIELGVPHLGATLSLKNIIYGSWISSDFYFLKLGIIPPSEIRDISLNSPSIHQLAPSKKYFDFYNNFSSLLPYPFKDDRDIDSNNVSGSLTYDQTKSLLSNLGYNTTVFNLAETFHTTVDATLNNTNGVRTYLITGSAQPTLGQIREGWLISWPKSLIAKRDEIYINGDDTVPLYSSSLKNDSLDFSGGATQYFVEQKHSDLVRANSTAMQTVKAILNEIDIPTDVKNEKITLEGKQITVDQDATIDLYDSSGNHTGLNNNGEPETNITGTFYNSIDTTKHVFVKKSASTVTVNVKASKNTNITLRTYSGDTINKTTTYLNVPSNNSTVTFTLNPSIDSSPTLTLNSQTITPTSEVTGSESLDQSAPGTEIKVTGSKDGDGHYNGTVTVTLSAFDNESGVLKTEYSIDNGSTINTYSETFPISSPGNTTIYYRSVDKVGNEESMKSLSIDINGTSGNSSPNSSTSNSSTSQSTSAVPSFNAPLNSFISFLEENLEDNKGEKRIITQDSSTQGVLGVKTENFIAGSSLLNRINNIGQLVAYLLASVNIFTLTLTFPMQLHGFFLSKIFQKK